MSTTATLLGSTGLIGGHILNVLLDDPTFKEIKVIVRRPIEVEHPRIKVSVIDFNDLVQFESAIEGSDVVFCAIGTTQKKVRGDKEAYRKIDFDIPVHAAKFALKSGCKQFLVVSSVGADSKKSGFYLKLKGEVEDALLALNFKSLSIFRPSLLLGKRSESRVAEGIGQFFSRLLKFIMPEKLKPIEGAEVAKAMVAAAKLDKEGVRFYHYKEMRELLSNFG